MVPPRPGRSAGEWTPDYLTFPWAPELLKRAAPEPSSFSCSETPSSGSAPVWPIRHAWACPDGATRNAGAVQRGFYHRALQGWLEEFDLDRSSSSSTSCASPTRRATATTFRNLGWPSSHPEADGAPQTFCLG